MNPVNDKWIRIGSVVLLLLNLFLMDVGGNARSWKNEFLYIAVFVCSVVIILESGRWLILQMHHLFWLPELRAKRLFCSIAIVFLSNAILIFSTFNLSHYLRGMHANWSPGMFLGISIASLVLALAQSGIYEGLYYFTRLTKLEQEKEELQKINLRIQYDSLKQQVNPHFLFNSINTVSSLIDKDSAKAKKFLAEMSKVYRYLLRNNEEGITSLATELEFLKSYWHLLKTRFGDAVSLDVMVDDRFSMYSLPALSLQLLIENAVKHNSIDSTRPLKITIHTEEPCFLTVSNNLQRRRNALPTTQLGLSNIIAKYKLLGCIDSVKIFETEDRFTVMLPLLKNVTP